MSNEAEVPKVKVVDRRWWARQAEDETARTAAAGSPASESRGTAASASDAAEVGEAASWTPAKPTYVEELERRLAEKDQELQQVVARYRESSREFEEARVRLRREVAREVERGTRSVLADLLEVVDNLDRAIDAARQQGSPASVLDGIELVRKQFLARLQQHGVTRVDPLGERFDPARHEAVTRVPAPDHSQDGIICGVVAPGYLIRDEVLRPAMVAVMGA